MLMDELIGDGVEALLSIGFAGCLDDGIDMGEFIVCEKAIRDEGTSHHYVESEKFAHPSEILVAETERLLADRCEPYHAGPSWTTDAIYRETKEEVRRYAEAGSSPWRWRARRCSRWPTGAAWTRPPCSS
jgi:uridine phosphorylase